MIAPGLLLLLSLPFIDLPGPYLLIAAMPCGINTLLVAHVYGLDSRLAAQAIAWTTSIVVVAAIAAQLDLGIGLRRALLETIPLWHYDGSLVRYPVEEFTDEERRLLSPHFTNLDRPVFAWSTSRRRSRAPSSPATPATPGTLRRLYLEEFAADVPEGGRPFEGEEGERAAGLYERVFMGYGDDSIAQVGGAHVACEWVSNVLTKVLQRGRLAAYLEQSTRYIPYDQPMPESAGGGYRYYRDDELGPEYAAGDGRAVRDLLALARPGQGMGGRALAARRRARGRLAALDPGEGPRPARAGCCPPRP